MMDTFHTHGLICQPAPNRYRVMLKATLALAPAPGVSRYALVRDAIIARQAEEFAISNPLGLDIDPASGDTILIWGARPS